MIALLARTACVLAIALTATLPAAAQDYPKKTIELVVPFVAGGTTDNIARLMAQRFSDSWGQTVVVNNRAGGGSTIGTNAVAKAPPDGHTLLVTTIGFAINAGLQKLPYDPIEDFTPVTELASLPLVLVVHASLPVTNLQEFIALAKSKPGGLGLRFLRHRHLAASRRRDVQIDGRHRTGARAVQGQRRGHELAHGRACEDLFRAGARGPAAHQSRHAAGDRRHHRGAPALSARRAHDRRIGLPRLRDQLLAGRVRTRRHPERCCRQDQRRARSHAQRAGGPSAHFARGRRSRSAVRPTHSPTG